jgi:hypothetical protein
MIYFSDASIDFLCLLKNPASTYDATPTNSRARYITSKFLADAIKHIPRRHDKRIAKYSPAGIFIFAKNGIENNTTVIVVRIKTSLKNTQKLSNAVRPRNVAQGMVFEKIRYEK